MVNQGYRLTRDIGGTRDTGGTKDTGGHQGYRRTSRIQEEPGIQGKKGYRRNQG